MIYMLNFNTKKCIMTLLLSCVMLTLGSWKNDSSWFRKVAKPAKRIMVDFISDPVNGLSFEPLGWVQKTLVVGDVTGDSRPELILAKWNGCEMSWSSVKGYFCEHPIVFTWTGKVFERLDVNWRTGSFNYKEGSVRDLYIADLDHDGINEILVGAVRYRDGSSNLRNALHVFQWDGENFVAEYSDYCSGAIQRFDSLGDSKQILISGDSIVFPSGSIFNEEEKRTCINFEKGTPEIVSGVYFFRGTGKDRYEKFLLTPDAGLYTALATNLEPPFNTTVIQMGFPSPDKSPLEALDWENARFWQAEKNGAVAYVDFPLQTERPVLQMEAVDLDGDKVKEIVILAGTGWANKPFLSNDELIWQVFKKQNDRYILIFERGVVFSKGVDYIYPFFTVGDIDSDNINEIVTSSGDIYKWRKNHLELYLNLTSEMGREFPGGFENIYIGDVFGTGRNKIIFTARYPENGDYYSCPDHCPIRIYMVTVNKRQNYEKE